MDNDYAHDGNFITTPAYKDGKRVQELVPTSFIDELIERGLSKYQLDDLIFFRRITRGAKSFKRVAMRDLVGVDLTGKTCYVFHSNWEDSEWLSTSDALTVINAGGNPDPYYNPYPCRFKFNDEQEKWFSGESDDEDDEDYEPEDNFYPERLLYHSFGLTEEVIVIEH